jgi:hypothetical protein
MRSSHLWDTVLQIQMQLCHNCCNTFLAGRHFQRTSDRWKHSDMWDMPFQSFLLALKDKRLQKPVNTQAKLGPRIFQYDIILLVHDKVIWHSYRYSDRAIQIPIGGGKETMMCIPIVRQRVGRNNPAKLTRSTIGHLLLGNAAVNTLFNNRRRCFP